MIKKLFKEIQHKVKLNEKERETMDSKSVSNSKKNLEKKLAKKARRMSNEKLRDALWDVRRKSESSSNDSIDDLLIKEGIYAKELKNRELLEWALRTGIDK